MRILVITSLYPRPAHELIAPFNRWQIRALAAHHAVRMVVPVPWTERVRDLRRRHVTPKIFENTDGLRVSCPTYYYPPRILEHHWGRCYARSIRGTVAAVVQEFRPDVLLGCWAHPDGWAAVQLGRAAGLPVVIKVAGSDVLVTTRKPRRRERVAEALRAADGVIAVSHDLAQHVIGLGAAEAKVAVIPEGIDQELFCPADQKTARQRLGLPADGHMILFVGNLLLSKGAGVLLEACAQLRDRGRVVRCHLVGQGKNQPRLLRLMERWRLHDCVRLEGARPQTELPDWYRAADVVTLPSYSEGVPNALREALACGRPFVATAVGGVPELAGAHSRLVPPGDASALADALAAVLEHPPAVDARVVGRLNISWEESGDLLAERLATAVAVHRSLGSVGSDESPRAASQLPEQV